jgi:hypothetical protein
VLTSNVNIVVNSSISIPTHDDSTRCTALASTSGKYHRSRIASTSNLRVREKSQPEEARASHTPQRRSFTITSSSSCILSRVGLTNCSNRVTHSVQEGLTGSSTDFRTERPPPVESCCTQRLHLPELRGRPMPHMLARPANTSARHPLLGGRYARVDGADHGSNPHSLAPSTA